MPLLNSMGNIEELCLNILINHETIFIDDNHIKSHIFDQLLKLKKLEVNIRCQDATLTDDQKI